MTSRSRQANSSAIKLAAPASRRQHRRFCFNHPPAMARSCGMRPRAEDRYRRAIYTFRYRSVPYPMLQVFDAPNGESSCVRRSRANTPLQALTTLNEPLFLESARALALKNRSGSGAQPMPNRLDFMFRRVLSRPATMEERSELLKLLSKETTHFSDGQHDPVAIRYDRPRASAGVAHDVHRRPTRGLDNGVPGPAESGRDDHQGVRSMNKLDITRRWFFEQCGVGLGSVALGALLGENAAASTDPLAPKEPPFPARAKNVIFLFMAGAPSHLELFDNKPALAKFNGTLPPPELLKGYRSAFINPNSKLLGPKFQFAKHGQSGAELSEILPHLATIADDITIVKSMTTDAFNHAPGQLLMNTGTMQFGRPSMGSWVTYGLGSESKNLPAFVVFSSGKKGPSGGNSCWGSGFSAHCLSRRSVPFFGRPGSLPVKPTGRGRTGATRLARLHSAVELDAPRNHGRSRNCHSHQLIRDGFPNAVERAGTHGPQQGIEGNPGYVWG